MSTYKVWTVKQLFCSKNVSFTISEEQTTQTTSITSTSENETSKNNNNSKIEASQLTEPISTVFIALFIIL